jgi:hypothetical protein
VAGAAAFGGVFRIACAGAHPIQERRGHPARSDFCCPLHHAALATVTAPVAHILRRVWGLTFSGARSKCQHNEERGEPLCQFIAYSGPAIGSLRLGSLFRTFPTRALPGQHVISADGRGASNP